MPRDLLLPILVPILVVNVVLVVVAARAVLRRTTAGGAARGTAGAARAVRGGPPLELPKVDPLATDEWGFPPAIVLPPAATQPRVPGTTEPDERPTAERPTAEPSGERPRTRRFALPALHEDHERILRSIEAFLTVDASGSPTTDGAGRPGPATTASTIAVIGIAGYEGLIGAAGQRVADSVAAAVGETLRRAARGTDRIVDLGDGRFCLLLPATGERAAASYLRRVHTACDPWLGAAAAPVSLIVATSATGRDGDLEAALRRAERRFQRALEHGKPVAG
ncbi:MAG TPA: diguanylate cyclase [Candidatus Limnocylindrales bacterium]